ncbi:hypothetical protein HDU67_009653 [Dinochytrium kinnereticum]|nr:hypothetical protein HDU67_009653 [Dinochytrium kinnereticum]
MPSPMLFPLPAEVINIIKSDSLKFSDAAGAFSDKIQEVREKVHALQERVDSGELDTFNGVSLLELKIHGLLGYVTDLALYCLLKIQGQKLESNPVVDRLIEHRIVLERTRPLEQKLKYQIDKLLRAVATSVYDKVNEDIQADQPSTLDGADPLQFKPNPSNLASAGSSRGDLFVYDSAVLIPLEQQGETANDGIYRPPKVAPVPYEEQ